MRPLESTRKIFLMASSWEIPSSSRALAKSEAIPMDAYKIKLDLLIEASSTNKMILEEIMTIEIFKYS